MNFYLSKLEPLLNEKRFAHVKRVSEKSIELAKKYGASVDKAALAGLLHDAAKYLNPTTLDEKFALPVTKESEECFNRYPSVWHALYGPVLIKSYFQVSDLDVLKAVQFHTTGQENMSLLSEILFVADYIEPGRMMPDVSYIHELAFQDLKKAVYAVSFTVFLSLLNRGLPIHPYTMACHNDYVKKEESFDSIRKELRRLNQ